MECVVAERVKRPGSGSPDRLVNIVPWRKASGLWSIWRLVEPPDLRYDRAVGEFGGLAVSEVRGFEPCDARIALAPGRRTAIYLVERGQ